MQPMTENVWDAILSRVETKINRHSYHTWFKPTALMKEGAERLTVLVPDGHFRDWLTKHYSGIINDAAAEIHRDGVRIDFVTADDAPPDEAAPDLPRPPAKQPPHGILSPRYTFDSFVVGPSNQFAHAASMAVAEAPSRSYNPLFIYGAVGLGKTHLMHAIGHFLLVKSPHLTLNYISSERFMNEMINAVRRERILEFRERYRSMDVLLVDDIQFLAGKEGTQTEFFHTFNSLYDAQKQIVISSDCPASEIPALEDRLRSRFAWGLIADIQPPDLETKVAILKKKAWAERVPLPDDVALYIAGRIKSNVRELESSLIRLIAYASLTNLEISLPVAKEVLRDLIDRPEAVTIDVIQKSVANHYKLRLTDLKSRNRSKAVMLPRQVAMYLSKSLTGASLPQIGKSFGGKNHATVLHSIRKVEDLRKRDRDFNKLVNSLVESLR